MNFMKRIALFVLLNLAVILSVTFIANFFGIDPYLHRYGLDIKSLFIICALWGFTGSIISLALSREVAKWMMGIEIIDESTKDVKLNYLFRTVHILAQRSGMRKMPQVGVYRSSEPNAFATGPSKSHCLVAVSTGLLEKMSNDEIKGVIGHEISHITNGDMVTMTLLQGVVNTFVMFLARLLAYVITSSGKNKDSSRNSQGAYIALVYLFEIVFFLLGSLIVAAYSRAREFRADEGGASLAGRQSMISALTALKSLESYQAPNEAKSLAAFKISNKRSRISYLFSTHPPLEKRIERLKNIHSFS
jgi:heat shock protein HtpX